MPFTYRPLQGNDIRVLTLHPITNDADASSPLICTLEHVDLPSGCDVDRETRACKGSNYVWPEVLTPQDFKPLFNRSPKRFASMSLQSSLDLPGNDDELPWYRTWGDYVALSYCWGPETPMRSIILSGESFPIRQNLHDALVLFRSCARIRQGFKLWIDAICINQADTAERNQQLSRMCDIYASAWQVVTWLGPARSDSDLAVAALKWIAAHNRPLTHSPGFYPGGLVVYIPFLFRFEIWLESPLRDSVYKALASFFLRQYWQRLWILQEVAIARPDAPVACGDCWLTWDILRNAITFIVQDEETFGFTMVARLHTNTRTHSKLDAGRDRVPWARCWASERMWRLVLELTNLQQNQRVQSKTTDATDLMRPLLLGLEAQAELAEDRIYGLLAIKAIADRTAMTPTYGSSLQELYKDFSLQLLSKGDLNTLQLVSRHSVEIYRKRKATYIDDNIHLTNSGSARSFDATTGRDLKAGQGRCTVGNLCAHSLPSWAICMLCRPIPTARLPGAYQAGGSRPSHIFAKTVPNNGLLVQGLLLDVVTSLGACHVHEVDETYPTTAGEPQLNAYGDLDGARTALWKTILADTTAQWIGSTVNHMEALLNGKLWRVGLGLAKLHGFSFRRILSRNRKLVLSGYTLDQLILPLGRMFKDQKHIPKSKEIREVISCAVNVTAWRRLMSTKTGRMGLAPAGARLGDSVAILLGCDIPLILRRQEKGGWIVVGECYVHGVMYGEAIRGHDKFEEITLY
jgi:hypothetical protein